MFEVNREDYFARKEEEREEKLNRLRVTAGILEFAAVVLGIMAIFVLVLLIVSLVKWLAQDVSGTFSVILSLFE